MGLWVEELHASAYLLYIAELDRCVIAYNKHIKTVALDSHLTSTGIKIMFKVQQNELDFIRRAEDKNLAAIKVSDNKGERIFLSIMCADIILVFVMGIASAMMGVDISMSVYQFMIATSFLLVMAGFYYARFVFLKKLMKVI